jgi:hypothetical protein
MPGPVTLADMIAMGIGLRACRDRCGRSKVLDAGELADWLGPGTPVPALRHVFKCSVCGVPRRRRAAELPTPRANGAMTFNRGKIADLSSVRCGR